MRIARFRLSRCAARCLSLPRLVAPKGQEKGNVCEGEELARLKTKSELLPCSTNPIIQAEEFHAGDTGSSRQGGG